MENHSNHDHWHFASDAISVPKQLFVITVTLATILPRMPLDTPFSIGGHLSASFRKLLLLVAVGYLVRHWGKGWLISSSVDLLMTAVEGVSLSFLSLLTPYLLRKWMAQRVNIPGGTRNPGQALQPWVKVFLALSATGFGVRVATGDKRWWIIKRIADVLSFIPVTNTLRLYNTVTTSGAAYPGRGSVLSQVVLLGEYFAVLGHSADIFIRILGLLDWLPPGFSQSPVAKGLYANVLFAGYFRVLCHSILLNILDEAYIIGTGSSVSGSGDDPETESSGHRTSRHGPTVETVDDNETAMVPLVNQVRCMLQVCVQSYEMVD